MKTLSRAGRWAVTAFVGYCLVMVVSVHGERIALPEGVFYYQPAASVFGAQAVWINPAGLGRYGANSHQFMFDYFDNAFGKSWGAVSCTERMAAAYRKIEVVGNEDIKELIFAVGSGFGKTMYLGGSYRSFRSGPDMYKNRHLWNVGLMGHNRNNVGWGAVISNLNRGRLNGERTETEMRYSLAYRPQNDLVTLAVDMFLSTKTRLSNADFIYHAEIRPKPGLYFSGYIDSDKNFEIGFKINLRKNFLGTESRFNCHGNGRGTTAYVGVTSLRQPSLIPEKTRRLGLSIKGGVAENPPDPIFGRRRTAFSTLILNVYRAASDPSISEMVVRLDRPALGLGQAQELREAFAYFRNCGKQITCHLSNPNNIGYFIATSADRIMIPPVCQLNLVGLRAELTFYAGTLEKLGVKADIMRIGNYKTAAETYTQKASTEENRQQLSRILDGIYHQFVDGIARGRSLSSDSVKTVIDNGPFTSEEAVRYGLVDGLSYLDELKDSLPTSLPEITFRHYLKDTLMNDNWRHLPIIAIIVAEGEIRSQADNYTPFGNQRVVTPALLKKGFRVARARDDIVASVFRINSPGGYALTAEEIHRTAQTMAEKKPIAVSMANVGASGGYHIAMPAERLFANNATITGSIGIYGGKADLSGLFEKIDLGKELYTRGEYAGMLSNIRPFTDKERDKYYHHLNAFYEYFLTLVAENRAMDRDSIDALARGRVWTGQEAIDIGLIDELGGIKDAVDYIAAKMNLKDYRIEILPVKRPWFILPGQPVWKALASLVSSEPILAGIDDSPLFSDVEHLIMARMPYDLIIK